MNPLTNTRNISKLSERELTHNDGKTSWHDEYRDSAWIFTGGLPFDLSEGDVLAVFSQYGEIVNINLVRDKATGKSKGFAFVCYEDQRSTVLAVDNLNAIKILGRTIRVDHVKDYKPPKDNEKLDDITRRLYAEGCAPAIEPPRPQRSLEALEPPPRLQITDKPRDEKHQKKSRKRKSDEETSESSSSSSESDSSDSSSGSSSSSDEPRRKRSKKSKKGRKKSKSKHRKSKKRKSKKHR